MLDCFIDWFNVARNTVHDAITIINYPRAYNLGRAERFGRRRDRHKARY